MTEQIPIGNADGSSPEYPTVEQHITLAQAAKMVPGRPSSNCIWRWCREGVKAAVGQRVRLKHVRFGSRIYTTRQWLNDFGQALAEADAAHFNREEQAHASADIDRPHRSSKRSRQVSRAPGAEEARRRHLEAEQDLDEAGL